eukprot:284818199_2
MQRLALSLIMSYRLRTVNESLPFHLCISAVCQQLSQFEEIPQESLKLLRIPKLVRLPGVKSIAFPSTSCFNYFTLPPLPATSAAQNLSWFYRTILDRSRFPTRLSMAQGASSLSAGSLSATSPDGARLTAVKSTVDISFRFGTRPNIFLTARNLLAISFRCLSKCLTASQESAIIELPPQQCCTNSASKVPLPGPPHSPLATIQTMLCHSRQRYLTQGPSTKFHRLSRGQHDYRHQQRSRIQTTPHFLPVLPLLTADGSSLGLMKETGCLMQRLALSLIMSYRLRTVNESLPFHLCISAVCQQLSQFEEIPQESLKLLRIPKLVRLPGVKSIACHPTSPRILLLGYQNAVTVLWDMASHKECDAYKSCLRVSRWYLPLVTQSLSQSS